MSESAATSASAASSGAKATPSGPSGDSAPEPALRVDFYVLEDRSGAARLRTACRLAEKAYLASQKTLIWDSDGAALKAFDDFLWTFADGSFVPHDFHDPTRSEDSRAPVVLCTGSMPAQAFDLLINLSAQVPPSLSSIARIVEIVDGDDTRRKAARGRFKAYRDLALQPVTHNIRGD